jgi:uncharacterized protein YbjT (DUF2867 family)
MSVDTTKPILVLGAKGKTGSRVAQQLAERGFEVRPGSRSSTPPFDWDDPATWAPVAQGVDSIYLTYQPDLAFPGASEVIRGFAAVAVANGVQRLVLLSGRNEEGAERSEEAVKESGVPEWTIVRSSFFAQNFSEGFWVDSVLAGELAVPAGDVADPFIDVDDIADIVTEALTTDKHVGQLYEVTGPRLLTFGDVAAEISAASGREVRYLPISFGEFATALAEAALPEDFIEGLTGLFREVFDGRSAYLSDGVERALDRKPKDFADYARKAAASGVWSAPVAV